MKLDLANVHPWLMERVRETLADFREETGKRAFIVSGYRGLEQQRALYAAYQSGRGGRAAPAGSSAHNYGLAVDVNVAGVQATSREGRRLYGALHRVAARYGLANIAAQAPDDPYHLQVPNWRRYVGRTVEGRYTVDRTSRRTRVRSRAPMRRRRTMYRRQRR